MKELGQFLKETRERKNISLEEVSVATKIGARVLQAIEDGDLEKLPPKAFVRGFIQSYAKYLGLDVKEILERFQETVGSTNPKSIPIPEVNKLDKSLTSGFRNIVTVSAIVLTIIGIIIIQRVISKREADMRAGGDVQAVTGDESPLVIKASPSPVSINGAGGAMASASVSPSPSPSPTPSPTATPTATPAPKSKAVIKLVPTATPSPAATAKPTVTATATPAPSPAATPEASAPQEVIIEALDKVTIKVTIDAKATQEITLNADQIQTFKAKSRIKIVTPDGGAISIIQNGYDLGVPGNLGQPKTMVFPK